MNTIATTPDPFRMSKSARLINCLRNDARKVRRGRLTAVLLVTAANAAIAGAASAQTAPVVAAPGAEIGEVVVTARHRTESAHSVPATISVVGGAFLAKTNTTNIGQLVTLLPSVQFTFLNPRNSSLNIRGLGNLAGVASDGTDPGVGFYVDQVYYSRPATTTFDLVDIDHVEVFDGPQGTLFGKNTTAGLISITTASPSFKPELKAEVSGGNYGYYVAKGSITGPIIDDVLAGRLSLSTSGRQGNEINTFNGKHINGSSNFTARGQLLYTPNNDLSLRLIADYGVQDASCCTSVLNAIISPANGKNFVTSAEHFGYTPVLNPFSRNVDVNSPVFARQETGGASLQADWSAQHFTLTSITAGRFWNWWPGNDADSSPLSVLTAANQNDYENQVSQEFRITSKGDNRIDYVGGLYFFHENVSATAFQRYGDAGSYFLLGTAVPSAVLDGYGQNNKSHYVTTSYAAYGQATWHVTSKLNLTGGLRYTYDQKSGQFDQTVPSLPPVAGPPSLTALRLLVNFPVDSAASLNDGAVSGRVDLSYAWTDDVLTYATYARGNRSGGINLSQPTPGSTPTVAPETIENFEAGAKMRFFDRRFTLNASAFYEVDHDYQGTVLVPGTTLAYLANIPKVITRGIELNAQADPTRNFSFYASGVFDDAYYADFPASPCALENLAQPHCSLTGQPLVAVPRWSLSAGGEYRHPVVLGARAAEAYLGIDDSFRSSIYTTEADSIYSLEPNLNLLNARVGLRTVDGRWDISLWGKNIIDKKYFTTSSPGIGNTGAIYSALGDPATWGATLRVRY